MYNKIVFLQNDNAKEALDILEDEGQAAALEYLKQWDTQEEYEQSHQPAAGPYDSTHTQKCAKGTYIMSWNDVLMYIGLELKV